MTCNRTLRCLLVALTCCLFPNTHVAAQKPIVDTQKTNPTQTISSEELNKLPGSRSVLDLIKVMPGVPSGYSTNVGQAEGMNIISINGPGNQVVDFYLPNEIFQGQSFTGTMKTRGGAGSETKINPFVAGWEGEGFHWESYSFDGDIVRTNNSWEMKLRDRERGVSYDFQVPVSPQGYIPSPVIEFPTSGTAGNPLQIRCPTTGLILPNTYVKIGTIQAPILTSTAGSIVVQNTYLVPGLTEIEMNIGKGVEKHKFRNITLRLSADKTNLMKNETTPLRIEVAGLENLRAPATMTIDATGVISMAGGNSQRFAIPREAIGADGIYRLGKTLTGTSAGGFGVKVTVLVEREDF